MRYKLCLFCYIALCVLNCLARDNGDKQYSFWPYLNEDELFKYTHQFNDFYPFLELDHLNNPDAKLVYDATTCLKGFGQPLPTQMKYGLTHNRPSLYSQKDVEHPIILIPAYPTIMSIRPLPLTGSAVGMESLKVPDGNGNWIDATEDEREFYSYTKEGG